MAFIPVPGVIQSRIIYLEDNGIIAQNVLYNAYEGVIGPDTFTALGELWQDVLAESIVANMTQNWAIVGVNMRDMSEEVSLAVNYSTGFPLNGTSLDAMMPDQVSYTVTLQTQLIGRSQRGRIYGVGIPGTAIQSQTRLNGAAQGVFTAAWETIRQAMETEGFPLQVVSFATGGLPRTEGQARQVTSAVARFPLATQRRRLS